MGSAVKVRLKSVSVREILARRNKTQAWFADKLGVAEFYVTLLMTGQRNPAPKMRKKIQRALKPASWDSIFEIIR